jgi:putative acetyltransferase
MNLYCRRALPQDFPAIAQLLELYQYELCDIWPQPLDAAGRYGYELSRHARGVNGSCAHVALLEGRPAGVALVAPAWVTRTEGHWLEQFFVPKARRRAGVGRALAHHVFTAHPGPWEVGQMPANAAARRFWRRVIGGFTGGAFEELKLTEGAWQGTVQRFTAGSDVPAGSAGAPVRLVFRADDLTHPDVIALLEEHLAHMHSLSPPESVHALPVEALRAPGVTFWTAWRGDELAACGALKALADGSGEVKAMRTPAHHRGTGAGFAMLEHIVAEARRRGCPRLWLETGAMTAFEPARRLYERFGFRYCPPFGDYRFDPLSTFMTLAL